MPRGDGTGPLGQGPRIPRGYSRQAGKGLGRSQGNGFGGGRQGKGPVEYCLCPACETKVDHQPGTPCASVNCPKCGVIMRRG